MRFLFLIIGLILIIITSIGSASATYVLDSSITNEDYNLILNNNSNTNINSTHIFKSFDKFKELKNEYNELNKDLKEFIINNKNSKELNNKLNNKSVDPKLNNLINTSSHNTNINKSFVNNSSNIHYNITNLVNLNTDKDKHNVSLFNNTLHNHNQYNKTFKLLGLNHSINDNVNGIKELNNSKSNSNICDDSREDSFLINPVPEFNNKDNIMFLILLVLLVLLGAIIVYKIKK